MINRYGAQVPAGLDRRKVQIPIARTITGYAVYTRAGYTAERVATCNTKDIAELICGIMRDHGLVCWIELDYVLYP
jgi:hypothetical protein